MSKHSPNKAPQRQVSVFVSTLFSASIPLMIDTSSATTVTGKRFVLNDYANKEDFIGAALAYAVAELGDDKPQLLFDDIESELCVSVFIDYQGNISEELWKMIGLSDYDLSLLDAYLSYHALLDYDVLGNSVEKSLAAAKQCYIGYFPTHKDFVEDTKTHTRRNSYNHRCHYFRQ